MRHEGPILIASDFSEGAAAAEAEGRQLAERLGVEAELLHVFDPSCPGRSHLDALLRQCSERPALVLTRTGTPWVEIVRRAVESGARAVVVGSHGSGGFQPLSPGTTTLRLLLRCPVPVLVVPARTSSGPAAAESAEAEEGSSRQPSR